MDFKKVSRCEITKDNNNPLFCGPAVLQRFGLKAPKNASMLTRDLIQIIQDSGKYNIKPIPMIMLGIAELTDYDVKNPTLTKFLSMMYGDRPYSDFDLIIFTNNHVMCMKDGKFTDTDRPATGRRRVIRAYMVVKNEEN